MVGFLGVSSLLLLLLAAYLLKRNFLLKEIGVEANGTVTSSTQRETTDSKGRIQKVNDIVISFKNRNGQDRTFTTSVRPTHELARDGATTKVVYNPEDNSMVVLADEIENPWISPIICVVFAGVVAILGLILTHFLSGDGFRKLSHFDEEQGLTKAIVKKSVLVENPPTLELTIETLEGALSEHLTQVVKIHLKTVTDFSEMQISRLVGKTTAVSVMKTKPSLISIPPVELLKLMKESRDARN